MPNVSELSVLPVFNSTPAQTDYLVAQVGVNDHGTPNAVLVPISKISTGSSLVVGTSPITGGGNDELLYDNAGVLGALSLGAGLEIQAGMLIATGELTIDASPILSGTNNTLLYDNNGVVSEATVGSGLTLIGGILSATGGGGGDLPVYTALANTAVQITSGPGSNATPAASPLNLLGGAGFTGGVGGEVFLYGGSAGTGATGGNVALYGGSAGVGDTPGAVKLFGGNAGTRPVSSATSPAASLIIEPYAGYGGKFQARGGYGAGGISGGPIFAFGGNSDSGKGGGFYSFAGNSTTGNGGLLRFSAGSSTTVNTFGATCSLYGGSTGAGGGFSVTSGADYGNHCYAAGFYCGGGSATGAGNGGTFAAFGGTGSTTGNGGYLTFIAGSSYGSGVGGNVNFYGGSSPSSTQGIVRLFGGGTDHLRPVTNPSAIAPASIVITGPPSSTVGGSLYLYAGHSTTNGNILMKNLPTSAAGLPSGALWNNSGVLNIVP